jgi:hypothetical protein
MTLQEHVNGTDVWDMGEDSLRAYFVSRASAGAREALALAQPEPSQDGPCEPFGPSATEMVQFIMQHRKASKRELQSPGRTPRLSGIRQEIAYWLRMKTKLSYPQIAKFMGVKDHTSAYYAVGKYAAKYSLPLPEPTDRPWSGAGRPVAAKEETCIR